MASERRRHPRLFVEGLSLWIEGTRHEIIDISVNAVRVTYADEDLMKRWQAHGFGARVRMVLKAGPLHPPLEVALSGTLVRWDGNFAVFAYVHTDPHWQQTLDRYDTALASVELADLF